MPRAIDLRPVLARPRFAAWSGTQPAAPQDQRYASGCSFGAVRLREGKGATLLRHSGTAATQLHLAEISATASPGRHAVLRVDQAGWHTCGGVAVPGTIALRPLLPKCPRSTSWKASGRSLRL